jgi:hypothetical protein
MSLRRSLVFSGLVLIAGAGLGCSQPAAVLPTDQKAKDLAEQPPPPIIGMGGPGAQAKPGTVNNTGSTKPAPGKNKLKGLAQ